MEYLSARMRKVEEFEKQLSQLRVQDEEEYNNMKMQLENDVEVQKRLVCAMWQWIRSPWAFLCVAGSGMKAAAGIWSPQLFSVHSPGMCQQSD